MPAWYNEIDPFRIIYADPPWRFEVRDRATGLAKSADQNYPTMKPIEIAAIRVDEWVASDAILAMWVYDPMLPAALMIGEAWGFKFCTVLFRWLKVTSNGKLNFGTGYHTRAGGCEEVWLFKRGKGCSVLRHDIRREFYSPLREHSRKPDEVADWLVDLYGDLPRLEMFARTSRAGWNAWGNEVDKFK